MKKVMVINQFALPRTEGGGTRHVDLFSRLARWQPVILAGNRNHYSQDTFTTDDRRFVLLHVPRQSGRGLARLMSWIAFSIQTFAVTLFSRGLDLVYASTPQPFGALAGLAAARIRRRPFVLEVRDLWPESMVAAGRISRSSMTYRAFSVIERLLAHQAARIVCVTDGWESHFSTMGVPLSKLLIIPNGTELADFATSEPRTTLRARQGITGFTAVFAGAHGPKDGIDLILDAAESLPHINFVLIGSGPIKTMSIEDAARRRITNVEFRNPVPKQRLADLLKACDTGIHAVAPLAVFDRGMSPNKLFDYMAAGLPIVSNAQVALSRIFRNYACGVLGPADSLAASLQTVYTASPEQRLTWSKQSIELVSANFSREKAAQSLERALDEVCTLATSSPA